ncbi:MAG TPA: GTP cyclohydrolase I [Pseudolysinimonas sp.]|nr:GTP cyclohydrolase I [Pseudolysinimonas sp.]
MTIDAPRIEAAVTELLAAIGEDTARPGLVDTPRRVAESYADFFSGIGLDPVEPLRNAGVLDAGSGELGELVLLRHVAFRSICEHHMLPFLGVAHLAYVPREQIVGLGRLPKVLTILSARPQLQERLGEQVADAFQEGLDPLGVLVVLEARHDCISARGARQTESSTVTIASRGTLADPTLQAGVLSLIGGIA